MSEVKSRVCNAKGIIRIFELLFSIITFACVATYTGWSKVDFTLFTGITAMLLCLIYLGVYAAGMGDSPTVALVELILDALWWIFWLATAACLSDIVRLINDGTYGWMDSSDANKFRTSCAFAWLTFFLWCVSLFLSITGVSKGRKTPGPPIPDSSNIAMV